MGTVNGCPCQILMDTGETQTLVNAEFVSLEDILDGSISVRCIHRDTINYPVAPIAVDIGTAKEIEVPRKAIVPFYGSIYRYKHARE